MNDEPFYAPNREQDPPRQPKPGEVLWTLVKGNDSRRAELRDDSAVGACAELQFYTNGVFVQGRRFESSTFAIMEADAMRAVLETEGWTPDATKGCA